MSCKSSIPDSEQEVNLVTVASVKSQQLQLLLSVSNTR